MVDLRNEDFANKMRSLPDCAKPFWKLTKILKSKPRPIPPLVPLNQPNDSVVHLITPEEKADAIGQHFVSSHNLGLDMPSPFETAVALNATNLHQIPINLPEESEITADELLAYTKLAKNMKAPGFDQILNLELKHLSSRFFNHLALIFNQCLRLGYFPSCWKSAKVIPIRKPGKDPTSPSSYRPISLLSGLSKLFERAVYHRLLAFADEHNLLLEEQFGFRKGRSTVHQLTRVTNILRRNKSVSKTSAMALLDVEKAFDNVWHDGLVYKLQRYGLPIFLVKIIKNYLSDRTFRVSLNATTSDAFNIAAGVPQGSILGPILFNLFTSDIPALPDGGSLSLFADDTSIIYKGRVIGALTAKLQRGLNVLSEYFNSWKIRINAAKTQVIVFPHSKSPRLVPSVNNNITLNGTAVEWSKEVVYLGVTLDSKLIFREHVDKTKTKCNVLLRSLYPLINRRSSLSLKNKLAVYKQIILPVIEYGVPIWETCANCHHLKLQRVQNKFLRMILNSPPRTLNSEVHRLAGLETLVLRRTATIQRFRDACLRSDHQIIRDLVH